MANQSGAPDKGSSKTPASRLLPELPSHASGVECNPGDGFNRLDKDFMRAKLSSVIQSGEIFQDGWTLVSRAYKIPYMLASHNNLELIAPDGRMFASLDTQQIERGTGAIKGYFPDGQYAAPVLDDCTKGNTVVLKENLLGETVIVQGRGTNALLGFARAAQIANESLSAGNLNYRVFPDTGQREANSNTLARSFAEVSGARDIYQEIVRYAASPLLGSPGLDVDLIPDKNQPKTRYDQVSQSDMVVLNQGLFEGFLSDMKALHPVAQQERALQMGTQPPAEPLSHAPAKK